MTVLMRIATAIGLSFVLLKPAAGESPSTFKPPLPGELGRHVNPFIGSGGVSYLCGNEFPGATLPFGMVRLCPDTVSESGRQATNTSGYYYRDSRILGFSHTRLAGTGAVDGGNFRVIPLSGKDSADDLRHGLKDRFAHRDEVAFPGYYSVSFPDRGLQVELTATRRVGVHRYRFAAGDAPHFLIHVSSMLGRGASKDGHVRIIPGTNEIEGSVRTFGTFTRRYGGIPIHFVARCDRRFAKHAVWQDGANKAEETTAAGDDVGVDLLFDQDSSRSVELKLAISYVSVANARENLDREAGSSNFDQVLEQARHEWEQMLGRIRIAGGNKTQQAVFYTALYHSLQMPTVFNDVNGDYLGFDGRVHRAVGFNFYTDLSLWDTFRTVHPLFMLIAPKEQRDMAVSLVEMAKQGGYLPRWPCGNGYSNSMFGTPADIMLTETWLKGIRDFDVETAYQAMRKTATGPTKNSRFSGRAGIEDYLKFGYGPCDLMKQSVARTLEYSYSDDCIARLAESLGHREDAKHFAQQALAYRKVWNPLTQYFQPRDSHGAFSEDFRPLLLTYLDRGGKFTHAYVEGSALQWRWSVPFDSQGLISLFKSKEYFVEELEQFFAHSIPQVSVQPNGYYWQGNQPDIYAAFHFNAAGRPDLTRKWVRWVLEHKYGDQENGVDGNDDGGTLSAWYVLASLGMFPTAGTDRYELICPLWTSAEIKSATTHLKIVADPMAAERGTVAQIRLNKDALMHPLLKHSQLGHEATLQFDSGQPR